MTIAEPLAKDVRRSLYQYRYPTLLYAHPGARVCNACTYDEMYYRYYYYTLIPGTRYTGRIYLGGVWPWRLTPTTRPEP